MNILYDIIAGSRLYGIEDENSDTDRRGVYLPTYKNILRIIGTNKTKDITEHGIDVVYHPLDKTLRLMAQGNPNIVEWLFAPPSNIVVTSKEFDILRNNTDKFISKNIIDRFRGFSTGEYNKVIESVCKKTDTRDMVEIESFGYAGKSASNAIRLIEEVLELVTYGNITFPRPTWDFLKEVKRGKVDYIEVKRYMDDLISRLKTIKISHIPDEPDLEWIQEFYISVVESYKNT